MAEFKNAETCGHIMEESKRHAFQSPMKVTTLCEKCFEKLCLGIWFKVLPIGFVLGIAADLFCRWFFKKI